MSQQERIEAAAKALCGAENIPWSAISKSHQYTFRADAASALIASDSVMFAEEAIERAARELWVLWGNKADDWVYVPPEDSGKAFCMNQARAVVAALRGEQS